MTTTKKTMKPRNYNADEVAAMEANGYVTPRAAAELYSVNLSMAYRATVPKVIGGKTVQAPVRVRLGDNPRNRYLNLKDWTKYMEGKRDQIAKRYGIRPR